MKLCTRISSIRRIVWKACRSCSAHSESTCATSLASSREAGCTVSPSRSSSPVSGGWASHSISISGRSRRSSSATAMSRREWPNPMGEEMKSARGTRFGGRCEGAWEDGRNWPRKSLIARVTATGSRACGRWPAPSSRSRRPPVISTRRSLRDIGWQRSSVPWMASTGQSSRRRTASVSLCDVEDSGPSS